MVSSRRTTTPSATATTATAKTTGEDNTSLCRKRIQRHQKNVPENEKEGEKEDAQNKDTDKNMNITTTDEDEDEEEEEEEEEEETSTRENNAVRIGEEGEEKENREEGNTTTEIKTAPPTSTSNINNNNTTTTTKSSKEGEVEGSQRRKRGRPKKNDVYESVLQYERRLQEEKEKRGAMRALLEAAEEDTDDHIQKKGKKMTATTTMNGNKKSFCNTDVVNDIHNNINTTNGDVKEEYQLKGGPDISGIEKLAADALDNILPNASESERMAHIKAFMMRGANGIIQGMNGQATASQTLQQEKQQEEKNEKSHISPGKDYTRLLEAKRKNLSKKQPGKRKEGNVLDDTDISPEQANLHKTYKEALQRMRQENVRKSREQKHPSSKNSNVLNTVAMAQYKLREKNLAAAVLSASKEAKDGSPALYKENSKRICSSNCNSNYGNSKSFLLFLRSKRNSKAFCLFNNSDRKLAFNLNRSSMQMQGCLHSWRVVKVAYLEVVQNLIN